MSSALLLDALAALTSRGFVAALLSPKFLYKHQMSNTERTIEKHTLHATIHKLDSTSLSPTTCRHLASMTTFVVDNELGRPALLLRLRSRLGNELLDRFALKKKHNEKGSRANVG